MPPALVKTILVVDDDPNVRDVIAQYLQHEGYAVVTAGDGMEGLRKLEAGKFDLVITDIVMPYVSGTALLAAIKDRNPALPVIAITGYGKESVAVATEKKADGVMAKPMEMAQLKEEVRRLLT